MPLSILLLPPDQNGYKADYGLTGISTRLDGGASRFRADQLGAAFSLAVQWTCNKKNFEYLSAFYRTAVNYGALPFTLSLLLDAGIMQAYTAHFLPGTFSLDQQFGNTYVVSAKLEVLPDASYTAGDAALIAAGPDV